MSAVRSHDHLSGGPNPPCAAAVVRARIDSDTNNRATEALKAMGKLRMLLAPLVEQEPLLSARRRPATRYEASGEEIGNHDTSLPAYTMHVNSRPIRQKQATKFEICPPSRPHSRRSGVSDIGVKLYGFDVAKPNCVRSIDSERGFDSPPFAGQEEGSLAVQALAALKTGNRFGQTAKP